MARYLASGEPMAERTPAEAREAMRCMAYTTRGDRCKRRMVCGKYEGGRYVLCAAHARLAGWPIWMWA